MSLYTTSSKSNLRFRADEQQACLGMKLSADPARIWGILPVQAQRGYASLSAWSKHNMCPMPLEDEMQSLCARMLHSCAHTISREPARPDSCSAASADCLQLVISPGTTSVHEAWQDPLAHHQRMCRRDTQQEQIQRRAAHLI